MGQNTTQIYRPTQAVINLAAVKKNLKLAAELSGNKVMAVVKADAYGFGIHKTVKAIHQMKECHSLAVAFAEEALELRELLNQLNDNKQILTLEGFFSPRDLDAHIRHKIDAAIHHPEQIEMLKGLVADKENRLGVWLKCNSDMNRLGLSRQQALDAYTWISKQPHIKLLGIMTHFSSANRPDPTVSLEQIAHFHETLKPIWSHLKETTKDADLPMLSLSNSPGIISKFSFASVNNNKKDEEKIAPLSPQPHLISRPGLMLYGGSPMDKDSAKELGITAAMTLKSRLMSVRQLKKGDSVGYEEGTWVASNTCLMGIVPIGYADGYPFIPMERITKLPLLINGRKCFLGGRVSMDMLCVDLSNCPDAQVGDEVELWGDNLPVNDIAAIAGGPPQRLFAALTKRVPRVYQE